MKVRSARDVTPQVVTMPGAQGCTVRWLVDPRDGAPNFAMREFEVAPGGYTPKHHHPYEHEVYVLAGQGEVLHGDVPRALRAGDVVLVQPDDVHQFRNTGSEPLRFLCLVPNSAAQGLAPVAPECGVDNSPAGTDAR